MPTPPCAYWRGPASAWKARPTRCLQATLDLARTHRLTFYDAAYLEQALRTATPLATKDTDLKRQATQAGVRCLDL